VKLPGLGHLSCAIFSQTHEPRDVTLNSLPAGDRLSLRVGRRRWWGTTAPADSGQDLSASPESENHWRRIHVEDVQ